MPTPVPPPPSADIPRPLLLGAAGVALFAIGLAATGSLTGYGRMQAPVASVPVAERLLRFADRADGGVAVYDATDGRAVAALRPGTGSFVRGTLRALARQRRQRGVGPAVPFRLTLWRDGRLTLDDRSTGNRLELEGFGPTNAGAYAALLTAGR